MANYEEKTVLMDEATSKRAVSRIAYEIVERNRGTENLVIIGIQTKGVSLAKLIIKKIEEIEGIKLELGSLDITFYDKIFSSSISLNNFICNSADRSF